MKKYNPFEKGAETYEEWFNKHPNIFKSELEALEKCFEHGKMTIEIGVGTGVFAKPLNISIGVEPSDEMAKISISKGIKVIKSYAENLPISDNEYEQCLMITVDCFLNDIDKAFSEIQRILCKDGVFIIAFINRNSPLGEIYERNKEKDDIYKWADFNTAEEIELLLKKHNFEILESFQTITEFEDKIYEVHKGYGKGVFTVIKSKNNK